MTFGKFTKNNFIIPSSITINWDLLTPNATYCHLSICKNIYKGTYCKSPIGTGWLLPLKINMTTIWLGKKEREQSNSKSGSLCLLRCIPSAAQGKSVYPHHEVRNIHSCRGKIGSFAGETALPSWCQYCCNISKNSSGIAKRWLFC